MTEFARIRLSVEGLGIILYSPWAVQHIRPGTDYLEEAFLDGCDIARHVNASSLTGFATGGGGDFDLIVSLDPPNAEALQGVEFKVELGLRSEERRVGKECRL